MPRIQDQQSPVSEAHVHELMFLNHRTRLTRTEAAGQTHASIQSRSVSTDRGQGLRGVPGQNHTFDASPQALHPDAARKSRLAQPGSLKRLRM